MSIGKRIKELRLSKGLSQEYLAEKANVSQKNISFYERDQAVPSAIILKDIAIALDADLNYLFDYFPKQKTVHPLLARIREIDDLPQKERDALLLMIDTFLQAYRTKGKRKK
jgi:transcriptional regulator with XRE-family HTH domain